MPLNMTRGCEARCVSCCSLAAQGRDEGVVRRVQQDYRLASLIYCMGIQQLERWSGVSWCGRMRSVQGWGCENHTCSRYLPSDRGFCVGSNDKWRSCGKQERESGRAPDIATASPSDVAVQRPSYRVCVTWMNRSGTLRVACWSISSIPRGRTHLRGDLHLRTHALSLSFHCIQFLVVLPASAGRTAPWPEVRLPTPSVRPLSSVPIGVFAYLGIAVAHSRAPYWRRRLRWTVLTAWRLIFPLSRGRLSWSR